MSRATSRHGDVTNARDRQTVLCPLLISNYWNGGCWELKCAWFSCLLRSYKNTLQLCGLSEQVDVALITNQKWVWRLCTLKGSGSSSLRSTRPRVLSYVSVIYNVLSTCITCYYMTLNYTPPEKQIKDSKHLYSRLYGNFSFYRIPCSASLFSMTWYHVNELFHPRVNLMVLFLCCPLSANN